MSVKHDLIGADTLYRGQNYSLQMEYRDDEGEPVSLVGWDVQFSIYDSATEEVAFLFSISGSGIEWNPDAISGKFILSIPPSITETMTEPAYEYKLELSSGGDNVEGIIHGKIQVEDVI